MNPVVRALTAVGLVVGVLAMAPPASAGRAADRCTLAQEGQVRLDPVTGTTVQCGPGEGGRQWRPVARGTRGADATVTAGDRAPLTRTVPGQRTTRPGPPQAGRRCRGPEGRRGVSVATADLLACVAARWAVLARGPRDPGLTSPELELPVAGDPPTDPLPADLCGERGLPPGVTLPPGTTLLPGQPTYAPATDWTKVRRCQLAGTVASTDAEAVHRHFVEQCAVLGWRYDPRGDERLPADPSPGPFYDREVQMVLGECRTRAGNPTDRRQRQPWYLAWGVTVRPGADRLELIVELRDTSRIGGRP